MIKNFFISLLFIATFFSYAQEGTSSPYSFFGLGDVKFRGSIDNRSMGEVGVIPDSIHINLTNPAMLSNIKLTTFSAAGTFSPVVLRTNSQKEKAQRTSLDYLSIAMPAKNLAFGFGLLPYSSVGYNIVNNSTTNYEYTFNGSGGVNKAYLAFSYRINKQFSVGGELQYNFGKIETTNTSTTTIESLTREQNTSTIGGVNFNFGLAHQAKLTDKIAVFSGLTIQPESKLSLSNTRNIAIIQFNSSGQELVYDDKDVVVPDSKMVLPMKISVGTSVGQQKKWMVGTQITANNMSNFTNRYESLSNVSYENALKFSIGGYYIPKYTSFTNYLNKVTYRAGFRYENTGIVVNNLSILDRAVTLGFGLPLSGTFSNINIGFEFGKRGTTNAGLIEENYSNISFAFSFNDRWFQKRKYD
jgi:long-subunit fatty acid transport protein